MHTAIMVAVLYPASTVLWRRELTSRRHSFFEYVRDGMPPYRVYGRKAFLNTDYVEDLDKLMSDKSVKRYIIRKKNNGSVNRDLLLRLLWPESQGLL